MATVVIAGSATLQEEIAHWRQHFIRQGHTILNYPVPIPADCFIEKYPTVHQDFLADILKTDIFFVCNVDRQGVVGKIGAESFAELGFAVAQNLLYERKIDIIVLQPPARSVECYEEVMRFASLGWLRFLQEPS